ncbi:MAG: methyltransferase domain-containing protein [bacterium]|nr:methyltransferase domain-containing protein [bacterium]
MSINWSKPITVEEMYGDWDYETAVAALERSLNPRRAASIFDTVASLGIGAGDRVLDIGGRDGHHGLQMAERFGCSVMSVDPAPANIADGLKKVAEHEYGDSVEIVQGAIEQIPAEDNQFDLVFSRDMMGHVADRAGGLAECARVLKPGGAMVVHEVVATDLLEPREAELVCAATATVPRNLDAGLFEEDLRGAGFTIEALDLVGSEWYEASQEAGVGANYAMQISRLRRAQDELLEELGDMAYRSMYGNALWGIFILIGKLETRLYTLRLPE